MRIFDPRLHGSFDPGWWTAHHPLHVCKSSAVTIAVRDMAEARDFYVDIVGGTPLHETDRSQMLTRSAFVAVGDDLVLELAEPTDTDSPPSSDMEINGQSLYSVSLKVADLAQARRYLRSKGFEFTHDDGTTMWSDPATSQGVVFGFTTWEIPNDARPQWA